MGGREKGGSHGGPCRVLAPACEYVAMPLGSSSAAPVIKPGPSVSHSPLFCWVLLLRVFTGAQHVASRPMLINPSISIDGRSRRFAGGRAVPARCALPRDRQRPTRR